MILRHGRWWDCEAAADEAALAARDAADVCRARRADHAHEWNGDGVCACGAYELADEDAKNYPPRRTR